MPTFGPFKDKHRYLTGVLLLSRMILSLINILGHPYINLLSIITFIQVLMMVLLWKEAGGIYKLKFLSLLDAIFLYQPLSFGLCYTLYSEVSNGNRQYYCQHFNRSHLCCVLFNCFMAHDDQGRFE